MEDNTQSAKKRGRPREFDRQKALCAALTVFWKHGYENATMRMLSKAMGIGSPSIYCAFGNKAELFIEAVRYYRKKYWQPLYDAFFEERDIYKAVRSLFDSSARVLLSATAPCGCLTVSSALCIPAKEKKLRKAISELRASTVATFSARLNLAVKDGQLPLKSNIAAIAGALTNFFEGLALQATGDICQEELIQIAVLGVNLLPAHSRPDSGDSI